jgi:hypothetical protein
LRFRLKRKKREGEGGKTKKRTNGGQKDAGGDDRITSNDMPQSIGDTHCNDENGDNCKMQLQSAPPALLFFPAARNESEARQELDFVERERERERERVLMLKSLAGILILKTFVPLKKS